ncbi:MAG: hypothetical protein P8L44_10475, partial [Opitutales bacterium]|nr:hypothetical protein [Opitutales bacterium]
MKIVSALTTLLLTSSLYAAEFYADWSEDVIQKWIGRHFWQNSYRDWQQAKGRIEVTHPGGNRSAVVTTYAIDATKDFSMSVRMGQLQSGKSGWGGFKLGLQGNRIHTDNWKNQMIHCIGTAAGITADGKLFIDQVKAAAPVLRNRDELILRLVSQVNGNRIELTLSASNQSESISVKNSFPLDQIDGLFALTSHNGDLNADGQFDDSKGNDAGPLSHWFDELKASGAGIVETLERQFGPVAFNQFVTSSGTLRMNAQLAPFEKKYVQSLDLEIFENKEWKIIAAGKYHRPSSSALFTIPHWDVENDIPYRIVWKGTGFDGKSYTHHYEGT